MSVNNTNNIFKASISNISEIKNSGVQILAEGSVLFLVGSIFSLLANVLYTFIYAKYLGPNEVGLFNLALTIITLISLIMIFGLDRAMVRYIPYYRSIQDHSHQKGVILSGLLILVAVIIVLLSILFFLINVISVDIFNKPELTKILSILFLGLPFIAISRYSLGIAQAEKLIKPIIWIEQVIVPIARIIGLIILFYWIVPTAFTTAISYAVASIFGSIPAMFVAVTIYKEYDHKTKHILMTRKVLKYSFLVMCTIILSRTNTQTETIILGIFSTKEQLGIYTIALKITVLVSIFLDSFSFIFTPFISENISSRKRDKLSELYNIVTRWSVTLALPVALIIFLECGDLLSIIGSAFLPALTIIRVLVVAQMINVFFGPSGLLLIMTDHTKVSLANSTINLVVSIILDLILIPRHGAYGAAIAGGITIVLMNLMRLIQVRYLLNILPYNAQIIKPIATSIATILCILLLQVFLNGIISITRFFIISLTGFLIYFVILFLMGFDETDKVVIGSIIKSLKIKKYYNNNKK